MQIPTDFQENIKFRIELNYGCETSAEKAAHAKVLIERNIESFFDIFLYTYEPRKKPKDRPFILWAFQRDYVNNLNDHIADGKGLLVEKSRDMGVTWTTLGVFLYRWIVFSENFLVGSRNENLVDRLGHIDTLFERLRYMVKSLPPWLKKAYGVNEKNMPYMRIYKDNGASLIGESMNENFSRQGRYNAILLDEFAFVDNAESIWTACGDSSPCKVPVSTPHGKHNKFARLRQEGKIDIASFHWKLHPEKDDAWYKRQKAERSDKDVAQELDINYTVSAGKPFYGGFIRGIHAKSIEPNPHKELILGWDYGYHHPACVVSQVDAKGRWILLDCIFGEDELIEEFGNKVKDFLNYYYEGYQTISYGDPAGTHESDKSRKTSAQILGDIGFNVISRPSNTSQTNYDARKAIIEGKFKRLIDGVPELRVNDIPRTQIIIEAFEGGWHYPDANKYGFVQERAVREGFYEHPINCIDYIAVNMFSPTNEKSTSSGEAIVRVTGDLKDISIEIDDDEGNYGRYHQATKGH